MMDSERQLWTEKCGEILHEIFVEIRHLSWEDGNAKQINELADLAHNIPLFMVGRDDTVPVWIRDALISHAKRRWPKSDPEMTKFVTIWDMDDAAFEERYRKYTYSGLLPEAVAS